MTELFTENTAETLREKGWDNITPRGFYITLYREDMEFRDWECYCMEIDANPSEVDSISLLCVASKEGGIVRDTRPF